MTYLQLSACRQGRCLVLLLLAAACGDAVVVDTDEDGKDDTPLSCEELQADYEAVEENARACSPGEGACQAVFVDHCNCPHPANDPEQAVAIHDAFERDYDAGCFAPCTGCTDSPAFTCALEADAYRCAVVR